MIKIGITGSLASGKTTASKILSFKRGPLFSADKVVTNLYRNKNFKSLIGRRFKIKNKNLIKKSLKKLILGNKKNIKKLEKIIKYFNIIIFIKAKKKLRLKRFQSKRGDKTLFNLLNNKQMSDKKKIKFCDYVVVNEKNLSILKKNLLVIINKYV